MSTRSPYEYVADLYDSFWNLLPPEALFDPQFRAIAEALLVSLGWSSDELSWEAAQRISAN